MRPLANIIAIYIMILAHPAFGHSARDRNGDGRVDSLAVSSARILDQKVDLDFDGKFDLWVIKNHLYSLMISLKANKPQLISLTINRDPYSVRISRDSKTGRLLLSAANFSYLRESYGDEVDRCESVSGQVGISKSEALSAAPVVPQAPMHELTFVRPTESWVPAPPRVAQVTKDLAQPMIQYAERVWADIKPKVENELGA